MTRRHRVSCPPRRAFFTTLVGIAVFLPGAPARAQETPTPTPSPAHRAALVVDDGTGRVREICVPVRDDAVSGFELLRLAGLDVAYEETGGDVAVCRIDGVGPDFPREGCFDRCRDPARSCEFWGYYRLDEGANAWRFSDVGASDTVVPAGAVEGWTWGPQGTAGGNPPPPATFDRVCARAVAAPARGREGSSGPSAVAIAGLAAVVIALAALGAARARARKGRG